MSRVNECLRGVDIVVALKEADPGAECWAHKTAKATREASMTKRNDPCPCGSGLMFKRCCLLKPGGPGVRTTGELRFEPGSYGGPGGFMPSLACFRESPSGQKDYRFVLANPSHVVSSDGEAVARASADFSEACRLDDTTGSIEAMGRQLSARGYVLVEDFKIVTEGSA